MSKPIRRARECGTYQTQSSESVASAPLRLSDADSEQQTSGARLSDADDTPASDKGTLAAAGAALQAGATPKLFKASDAAPDRSSAARPRLDTVQDCIAAFRSRVPLTGAEVVRVCRLLRREMKARGLPLDWFTRTRRDDDPPLQ